MPNFKKLINEVENAALLFHHTGDRPRCEKAKEALLDAINKNRYDLLAAAALTGICASGPNTDRTHACIAQEAHDLAQAMLQGPTRTEGAL